MSSDDPVRAGGRSWLSRGSLPWRLAFCVLLILVVIGSLTPSSDQGGPVLPIPDWAQHAIGYGFLMATLILSQARPWIWRSGLALVVLGAVLELVQGWLGYRFAEAKDLLANAIGIAAVGLVTWRVLSAQARRPSKSVGL